MSDPQRLDSCLGFPQHRWCQACIDAFPDEYHDAGKINEDLRAELAQAREEVQELERNAERQADQFMESTNRRDRVLRRLQRNLLQVVDYATAALRVQEDPEIFQDKVRALLTGKETP